MAAMAEEEKAQPLSWRGEQVGTVFELSADMFWWHARWRSAPGPAAEAFRAQVEAGEDPEVLVGEDAPIRLVVTAATEDELEMKSPR